MLIVYIVVVTFSMLTNDDLAIFCERITNASQTANKYDALFA